MAQQSFHILKTFHFFIPFGNSISFLGSQAMTIQRSSEGAIKLSAFFQFKEISRKKNKTIDLRNEKTATHSSTLEK